MKLNFPQSHGGGRTNAGLCHNRKRDNNNIELRSSLLSTLKAFINSSLKLPTITYGQKVWAILDKHQSSRVTSADMKVFDRFMGTKDGNRITNEINKLNIELNKLNLDEIGADEAGKKVGA